VFTIAQAFTFSYSQDLSFIFMRTLDGETSPPYRRDSFGILREASLPAKLYSMMFPSFLGIGAQKCATTWLSHNLSRHPEIWMPPRKELHYFDYRIKDPRTPFVLFRARLHDNYHGLWRMQARNRTCSYLTGKHPLRNAPWDLKYLVPHHYDPAG